MFFVFVFEVADYFYAYLIVMLPRILNDNFTNVFFKESGGRDRGRERGGGGGGEEREREREVKNNIVLYT